MSALTSPYFAPDCGGACPATDVAATHLTATHARVCDMDCGRVAATHLYVGGVGVAQQHTRTFTATEFAALFSTTEGAHMVVVPGSAGHVVVPTLVELFAGDPSLLQSQRLSLGSDEHPSLILHSIGSEAIGRYHCFTPGGGPTMKSGEALTMHIEANESGAVSSTTLTVRVHYTSVQPLGGA